jgi:hypothetical protein
LPLSPTRPAGWSTALATAAYLAIESVMLSRRIPLGHDEATYLLRGRAFAASADTGPLEYWAPYRAPGVPFVLGLVSRVVGESVTVSRGVIVLLGAAVIVLTALLAARLGGVATAIVAPWLIVVNASHVSYASLLLLDIPAVALTLLAMLLVERGTRCDRVAWQPLAVVPLVVMAAMYVRFGATTNLAAGLLAVVVCRADLLWRSVHRWWNAGMIVVAGAGAAAAAMAVLLVPALTGSSISPYRLQRQRQVNKSLDAWASYSDMFDLLWPNGSRAGETFTVIGLLAVGGGTLLTLAAVWRGRYRRIAVAGAVSTLLWVVGINIALAELFGNYMGLASPFFALLAAPGWAWAYECVAARGARPRVALIAAGVSAAALGTGSAAVAAQHQIDPQRGFDVYRAAGVELGTVADRGRCAVLSSYVQIGWYSECEVVLYAVVRDAESLAEARSAVLASVGDLPVDADEIYVAVTRRGKRQPTDEELEMLLDGAVAEFRVEHRTRTTVVYRMATG